MRRGERTVLLDQDFMRRMEIPSKDEGSRVYFDSEVPGFCCQVTYSGTRTFRMRYRMDGLSYSIKIGRWRDGREPDRSAPLTAKERALRGVTAGMARKQADALRTQIDRGENPGLREELERVEKQEKVEKARADDAQRRAEEARRVPMSRALDLYLADAAERRTPMRPSTIQQIRSNLSSHLLPKYGRKAISELTPDDIRDVVRTAAQKRIVDKREVGGQVAANHVLCHLRMLLNWALKKGMVQDSLVPRMDLSDLLVRERPRRRYLSPDEMAALMRELDERPFWATRGGRGRETKRVRLDSPQLRQMLTCEALRLTLLTGARKGEVYQMKWDHVDLAAGWWHKPHETTKTQESHEIALGAAALATLRKVRAAHADPIWVFPGKRRLELLERGQIPAADDGSHVRDVHSLWLDIRETLGMPDVRIHDLRHTHASVLISAGATLFDVGAQLGHKQAQTTMRYAHLMKDRKQELARKFDAFAAALPAVAS